MTTLAQLTRRELLAAARAGDVVTIESYFAQPEALEAALAVDVRITDDVLLRLPQRATFERELVPADAWVYVDDRYHHIFSALIVHDHQEVIAWLFTSPISTVLRRTLQFFLVDVAIVAVLHQNRFIVELLLESPVWRTFPNEARPVFLSTLVRAAIDWCRSDILSILSAHGADFNRPLDGFGSPLGHSAIHDPSGRMARDVHHHGGFAVGEQSALRCAVERNHHHAILVLLELGVDARARDDRRRETVLHRAAVEGFHETVTTLLETVCLDIDAQNVDGDAALTLAVLSSIFSNVDGGVLPELDEGEERDESVNAPRVIELLLEHGANTNLFSSGEHEYAPLHWAVSEERPDAVRRLLARGADVNVQTPTQRQTPAHLVVEDGAVSVEMLAILKILVDHGANLLCPDANGVTAMDMLWATDAGQAWLSGVDLASST